MAKIKDEKIEDEELIIEGKLVEPLPPFSEGLTGTITNAEKVTTRVRGLRGVRVTIKGDDGREYAEMLWLREQFGRGSKLGAFVTALGANLKEWIGKRIRIVSWKPRDRRIEVAK
jgi:hypothetical protein